MLLLYSGRTMPRPKPKARARKFRARKRVNHGSWGRTRLGGRPRLNVSGPPWALGQNGNGGEGGIRTPGTDEPYNGFRDRRIQPLCHLSGPIISGAAEVTAARRRHRRAGQGPLAGGDDARLYPPA